MIQCPSCQSENVFIERAEGRERWHLEAVNMVWEPPISICRECGTEFTHLAEQCPPAAELVAIVGDQVANRTHVAGLFDGQQIKDFVFWTEAEGLAVPVSPAEKYQKIYNMATLARFGAQAALTKPTPPPAPEKPKRRPAAKKPAPKDGKPTTPKLPRTRRGTPGV